MNKPPIEELPSLQQQAEAYIEWREGKEVECWNTQTSKWDSVRPYLLLDNTILRIKPAPKQKKWREFTHSELVSRIGCLIKYKRDQNKVGMIIGVHEDRVCFTYWKWEQQTTVPVMDISWNHAISSLSEQEISLDHGKTWLPCGVEVEE